MATLIITVLLGLIFAYFATLNTQNVSVSLGNNLFAAPVYMLVIVSVLIGLLISAIISAIDSIASSFALYSKDNKIKQKEHTVEQLATKIHDLEVENARLRGIREPVVLEHTSTETEEDSSSPRSFFKRFRYRPAA